MHIVKKIQVKIMCNALFFTGQRFLSKDDIGY